MTEPGAELALRAQPVLPMAPDQARQMMQAYQEMTASILAPEDFQRVDDKDFVKRSGFQKLAAAYGVSTEIITSHVETVQRDGEDVYVARVVVRAIHPSGRHADGDGHCASSEKRFRRGDQRLEHNLASTATTRAVNRAVSNLIAFGAVTAEEVEEGTSGSGSRGGPPSPAWAAPMNDIPGVAHNLVRVLQAAGVDKPGEASVRIGEEIYKLCEDSFPFALARLAHLLANECEGDPLANAKADDEGFDVAVAEDQANDAADHEVQVAREEQALDAEADAAIDNDNTND